MRGEGDAELGARNATRVVDVAVNSCKITQKEREGEGDPKEATLK